MSSNPATMYAATLPSAYMNEVNNSPLTQKPASISLVKKISSLLQAFRNDTDAPEDLVPPSTNEAFSRVGLEKVGYSHIVKFLMVSPDYQQAVRDAKALAESNPVFTPIIRKLTMTVAEALTRVEFESGSSQGRKAQKIVDDMLKRVHWADNKAKYIKAMLNEGGISLEPVISNAKGRQIDKLEYRPHETIFPIKSKETGTFADPKCAYIQQDSHGKVLAQFSLWQMIDVNLEESEFHNRGIPHLQAARQLLEYVGSMAKGLMQKWLRESGSIEHFNLEDAKKWEELSKFQDENQDTINASPENLVRQFFTKGKVKIERLFADASSAETGSIEFMLELIFLCAGISKELMGFKSHVVIRDMIELSMDNYFQTLNKIQNRLHAALRKAVDLELMLHGIPPEDVPYQIIGGAFEVARQVHITKDMTDKGSVSVNDIRKAANLPTYTNPLFDVPGLYVSPLMALRLAENAGLELPDDISVLAAASGDQLQWNVSQDDPKAPSKLSAELIPQDPAVKRGRPGKEDFAGGQPGLRKSSVKDSKWWFSTRDERTEPVVRLAQRLLDRAQGG